MNLKKGDCGQLSCNAETKCDSSGTQYIVCTDVVFNKKESLNHKKKIRVEAKDRINHAQLNGAKYKLQFLNFIKNATKKVL